MCKIFTLTNMSKVKQQDKLINTVAEHLGDVEQDGFGYVIQGHNGNFTERSLAPQEFKTNFKSDILSVPFVTPSYNREGQKTKATGAALFHGRTSTNHKTIQNTHPLNKRKWSLIHNGVVTDHGPKYEMNTTNDTEHVLERLSTGGIDAVAKHLTGYYAVCALDPEGNLHIFRDSIAPLYVSYIKAIDSFCFATTKYLIEDICSEMKWKHSTIEPMNENTYLIFENNKLVNQQTFTPRGETAYERSYSKLSLGYSRFNEEFGGQVVDASTDKSISESMFLQEVNEHADASYAFLDYHGNELSLEEFRMLDDHAKLYCTVVRSDGTLVDPDDYETEKLYSGAI